VGSGGECLLSGEWMLVEACGQLYIPARATWTCGYQIHLWDAVIDAKFDQVIKQHV